MQNRIFIFLILTLFLSAISLVNSQFHARRLFIDLEKIEANKRELEINWSKFQIELSELTRYSKINSVSKVNLKMLTPDLNQTQFIKIKKK
tara:strand:+ start:1005 stop:1277 length:273 start_codon:yes stop_codon:yes gene_type:complete